METAIHRLPHGAAIDFLGEGLAMAVLRTWDAVVTVALDSEGALEVSTHDPRDDGSPTQVVARLDVAQVLGGPV